MPKPDEALHPEEMPDSERPAEPTSPQSTAEVSVPKPHPEACSSGSLGTERPCTVTARRDGQVRGTPSDDHKSLGGISRNQEGYQEKPSHQVDFVEGEDKADSLGDQPFSSSVPTSEQPTSSDVSLSKSEAPAIEEKLQQVSQSFHESDSLSISSLSRGTDIQKTAQGKIETGMPVASLVVKTWQSSSVDPSISNESVLISSESDTRQQGQGSDKPFSSSNESSPVLINQPDLQHKSESHDPVRSVVHSRQHSPDVQEPAPQFQSTQALHSRPVNAQPQEAQAAKPHSETCNQAFQQAIASINLCPSIQNLGTKPPHAGKASQDSGQAADLEMQDVQEAGFVAPAQATAVQQVQRGSVHNLPVRQIAEANQVPEESVSATHLGAVVDVTGQQRSVMDVLAGTSVQPRKSPPAHEVS